MSHDSFSGGGCDLLMLTRTHINRGSGNLRARRRSLNLSQEALARRAGCSLASVSQYERGLKPKASSVLPKLLAALDAAEREVAP
jgi:transcriptional regulator with XRE-family HTH domain